MAVDIINPEYWITELFGSILVFAVFLLLIGIYGGYKKKLPIQWTLMIIALSFLMLPLIFEGFLSWVPLIIIVVGVIVGSIFYRFLDRT